MKIYLKEKLPSILCPLCLKELSLHLDTRNYSRKRLLEIWSTNSELTKILISSKNRTVNKYRKWYVYCSNYSASLIKMEMSRPHAGAPVWYGIATIAPPTITRCIQQHMYVARGWNGWNFVPAKFEGPGCFMGSSWMLWQYCTCTVMPQILCKLLSEHFYQIDKSAHCKETHESARWCFSAPTEILYKLLCCFSHSLNPSCLPTSL